MTVVADVTLSAFGKPCQTVLTVLSLLKHSSQHINKVHVLVERNTPKYDRLDLRFLDKLSDQIEVFVPPVWLWIDALDVSRLRDKDYRYSMRYQYMWEHSACKYLLITHNDVHFVGDVLPGLIEAAGDHIAAGRIGQCWNCPAAREHIVKELNVNNGVTCSREAYDQFSLTFRQLNDMYCYMRDHQEHFRNFLPKWNDEFREAPWPLPECRVNEVCCLINLDVARKTTIPLGRARPIGAYVDAGSHNMDVGTAWFRDVNRQGHRGVHFDTTPYAQHFIGHSRMFNEADYMEAERKAAAILRDEFADRVPLLNEVAPGLLDV